ncbi:MAG: hypothetical protein KGJ90_04080 [Patescibacteria group bacterium]|nr:hypothetical protein [Patescibacteria group bacterium]
MLYWVIAVIVLACFWDVAHDYLWQYVAVVVGLYVAFWLLVYLVLVH